jgi:hypothetical protein
VFSNAHIEAVKPSVEAVNAAEEKAKQLAVIEFNRLKNEQEAAQKKSEEQRVKEEEQVLAEEQADAWAEAEQRAKLQAKHDSDQALQQAAHLQAKASREEVHKVRRSALPLGKIAFGLVALSLIIAVVLPYVWPLQEYIAPLEQRLSAQLKQPVHIAGMRVASVPPKLQLQNVVVGNAQEIKISAVILNFDPLALFSDSKAISNAELQNITLDGRRLDQITNWLKGLGEDAQYPLRHLTIKSLQVNTEGVVLPLLNGSADLAQGAYTRIVLHSDDEKLNIELLPVKDYWQLSFGIKEKALPLLADVMFSDFSATGEIGDGEVNFNEIVAHAYGGIWSGSGKLSWRKGWQVQGRMQAKSLELEKFIPKLGHAGDVYAEGTFSAQSAKLAQLGSAPRLDVTFEVKKGVINGLDMVETARLSSQEHLPGGRTHFDKLTGVLQLENHNRHFRQVNITSGALSANGSFEIMNNDVLAGNFNAEIQMRAGNNPLILSGTLTQPNLIAH